MLAAPQSQSSRPHRGQLEPSHRRSRLRSFLHRAQPGNVAFCVVEGRTEKTVPHPARLERTAALQQAKAQSATLAIAGASQITAAATARAVGPRPRDGLPAHCYLSDNPRLVLIAPRPPAT